MEEEFIYKNPFQSWSVGEEEIWAEAEGAFQDVETINQAQFNVLLSDLNFICKSQQNITKVRFLVGHRGAGKSHLFSRLRRSPGLKAIFVFASNPPTNPNSILPWVIEKVVFGMKHPTYDVKLRPYSQLHAALYARLIHSLHFTGTDNLEIFHNYAQSIHSGFFKAAYDYLNERYSQEPDIARGLAYILHPEKSELAFRWLSGSTNMSDEELKDIEQSKPLSELKILPLLCLLGKIFSEIRKPIILVLDQLDLMTSHELVKEFERILVGLVDNSKNYYVVISLIVDRFDIWNKFINEALKTKLNPSGGPLPVVDIVSISDREQKKELIYKRLGLPYLQRLRNKYQKNNPFYPLQHEDIEALAGGAPVYPRELLGKASELYMRLSGVLPPASELITEIQAAFDKARSAINEQTLVVEKGSLVDRLAELIDVVCAAKNKPFKFRHGPLQSQANFQGTDTVLEIDQCQIRLLGHHAHQGTKFPNFLKQVMELPGETILVRDGAVSIAGKVTNERLTEFRKNKTFLHLPRPEIADIYALGQVLADMREGNFDDLATEPLPTVDNIKRCLGQIAKFSQNHVIRDVFKLVDNESPSPSPSPSPLPSPSPSSSITDAVRKVMQSARWLVFERLHRQLTAIHRLEVTPEELRNAIAVSPLRDELLCYPPNIQTPVDVHILIWSAE